MHNIFRVFICLCICLSGSVYCAGCNCSLEELLKKLAILKNSTSMVKKNLFEIDDELGDVFPNGYGIDVGDDTSTMFSEYKTRKFALNETYFGVNETEIQVNRDLKEACPQFKQVPELAVLKMANIWQVAYYKSSKMNVTCFRMYIERVSTERRKAYKEHYSTFNNTIDWGECHLEIVKVMKVGNIQMPKRKHFLQGSAISDKGILENIIIMENLKNTSVQEYLKHTQLPTPVINSKVPILEAWQFKPSFNELRLTTQLIFSRPLKCSEKPPLTLGKYGIKTITLQEETPDQWMTYKNLLLMRDCELGSVVVFSKVPTDAALMDVEHALTVFGEDNITDKTSCESAFEEELRERPYKDIMYTDIS